MDKKVLFNEALTALVEFAATQGNEITPDDVKLYFKDLIEDDSQYKFIYDYLAINKIKVDGFDSIQDESIFHDLNNSTRDNNSDDSLQKSGSVLNIDSAFSESEEELSFIKMYMNDLESIAPAYDGEVSELISKLLAEDLSVVERLIECHLSTVAELADKYRGKGVTFGDLIQEGNMGLMLAISDYTCESGDFDDFIRNRIIDAIESTVNSQINSDRIGQHLADKLNQLDAVTKDLSEKLGRVPEIKELAKAMSITEEEVSLLLKTSLDTLSINEDTQITSDDASTEVSDNSISTASREDPLQWRVNKK